MRLRAHPSSVLWRVSTPWVVFYQAQQGESGWYDMQARAPCSPHAGWPPVPMLAVPLNRSPAAGASFEKLLWPSHTRLVQRSIMLCRHTKLFWSLNCCPDSHELHELFHGAHCSCMARRNEHDLCSFAMESALLRKLGPYVRHVVADIIRRKHPPWAASHGALHCVGAGGDRARVAARAGTAHVPQHAADALTLCLPMWSRSQRRRWICSARAPCGAAVKVVAPSKPVRSGRSRSLVSRKCNWCAACR